MSTDRQEQIDFSLDTQNLFREESITDLKVGSIRRLVPIHEDGSKDESRTALFMGHSQIMTPEGPLPLQAPLPANNLREAYEEFPKAMQRALNEMVETIKKMQADPKRQHAQDDSRIIIPR